jgi:catechol 2,3-dioxygenase-like lactoylglutathione lyase family enzyme
MGLHTYGRDAKEAVRFYERYFGALEGATISNVRMRKDEFFGDDQWWPTFDVTLADGTKLEGVQISQDEEGNGPGFLFGLPEVRLDRPVPE